MQETGKKTYSVKVSGFIEYNSINKDLKEMLNLN